MKTATVKEIGAFRKWEGQHGIVYFYPIVLSNGDAGDIGVKQEGSLKIGDELNYTVESNEHGTRIKKVQANNGFAGGGFKGGTRGSNASFALSYSKDLMIASMPYHQEVTANQWAEATIVCATKFQAWLKENDQ